MLNETQSLLQYVKQLLTYTDTSIQFHINPFPLPTSLVQPYLKQRMEESITHTKVLQEFLNRRVLTTFGLNGGSTFLASRFSQSIFRKKGCDLIGPDAHPGIPKRSFGFLMNNYKRKRKLLLNRAKSYLSLGRFQFLMVF